MGAAEALGGFRQNMQDGTVRIAEHVAIPQPNDPPPFAFQKRRSAGIRLNLRSMMAAVEFNTEPGLAARQINDERWHDKLPGECRPIARDAPPYRQRRVVAQFTRSSRQLPDRCGGAWRERRTARCARQPTPGPSLSGRGVRLANGRKCGASCHNHYPSANPPRRIRPGRASIDAVLHPATTKALYFVADGTGGHVFADTLEEQNANVAKWYAIRRARGEM